MNKERFYEVVARVMELTDKDTARAKTLSLDFATEVAVASLVASEDDADQHRARASLLMVAVALEDGLRGPLDAETMSVDPDGKLSDVVVSIKIKDIVGTYGKSISSLRFKEDAVVNYQNIQQFVGEMIPQFFSSIEETALHQDAPPPSFLYAAVNQDAMIIGPLLATVKAVYAFNGKNTHPLRILLDFLYNTKYQLVLNRFKPESLRGVGDYAKSVIDKVNNNEDLVVLN